MHILYLHQYFVPPEGSGGTRSFEMARRWVQWGHRVTIVTSTAHLQIGDGSRVERTSYEGVDVVVLPVPYGIEMSNAQRVRAFAAFAGQACRWAVRLRADVVFATSTPLTIALPAMLGASVQRVPMVFEVRDLWPELPVAIGALRNRAAIWGARLLERTAYARSADVIALSPGMAEGVTRCGIDPRRVHVVPNACDVQSFDVDPDDARAYVRTLVPGDGPLVTYAGSFGQINDAAWLVDVAAATEGIRVAFVGMGPGQGAIEARARAAGLLNRRVFIRQPVEKSKIPYLLRGSTIATSLFLPLPAMQHNSANKFFDALAAATPVAINYGGWQAALLHGTGAGLVLPQGDVRTAATALQRAAFDGAWQATASRAAATLARTRFDRDMLARTALDVVERAVA